MSFRRLLNYYQLMLNTVMYAQQCQLSYWEQMLFPQATGKLAARSTGKNTLSANWSASLCRLFNGTGRLVNLLWNNFSKIITIRLAAQVLVGCTATANNTQPPFLLKNGLAHSDKFLVPYFNDTLPVFSTDQPNSFDTQASQTLTESDGRMIHADSLDSGGELYGKNVTRDALFYPNNSINISEILCQFDRIDAALQQTILLYNSRSFRLGKKTHLRTARSPNGFPFSPPLTCNLSEDEVNGVLSELKNIFSESTQPTPSILLESRNVLANDAYRSSCQQKMLEIKEQTFKVKKDFQKLMNGRTTTDDYSRLKSTYDTGTLKLQNQLDDLEKSFSQNTHLNADSFRSEIQSLKSKMDEAVKKLEKKKMN